MGVRLRTERIGDVGWAFHRQAVLYHEEFGYTRHFEVYVARGLPDYLDSHDAERDRLWVAELDGRPVGCIAVQHDKVREGWAKLRWYFVEREARGHGAGKALMDAALAFAREAGYTGMYLWTVSDLAAARNVYERYGFRLAEETAGCIWAPWANEQRWEKVLDDGARPVMAAAGRHSGLPDARGPGRRDPSTSDGTTASGTREPLR